MAAGVLLTVAGVWVLAQVLGGDALGRLGITSSSTSSGGAAGAAATGFKAGVDAVGGIAGGIPFRTGMR